MATLVLDEYEEKQLLAARAENGGDRYDEVWEGVYVMMAFPNNEHQEIVMGLSSLLYEVVQKNGLGKVLPGVNVSDRDKDWKDNYRCPDVAVFLNHTSAIDRGTHWQGGPDVAVEIVSRGDETRKKLGFYANVGTRELLIVDRFPWSLELYRLEDGELRLAGKVVADDGNELKSDAVPLSFALAVDEDRPALQVRHAQTVQTWRV